jgi:hypothetical protein
MSRPRSTADFVASLNRAIAQNKVQVNGVLDPIEVRVVDDGQRLHLQIGFRAAAIERIARDRPPVGAHEADPDVMAPCARRLTFMEGRLSLRVAPQIIFLEVLT